MKAENYLGEYHSGDQPAPKTQMEEGGSVLEETAVGQALMGLDLVFPATFSSSDFMVFSVS